MLGIIEGKRESKSKTLKEIKIYGERNSGTNYMEELLRTNLNARIIRYVPSQSFGKYLKKESFIGLVYEYNKNEYLGWKHGKPRIKAINNYQNSKLLVITVTKNPYSFLLSLKRRPYHYRGNKDCDFKTFISSNWQTIMRDNCGFKNIHSPMDLWNIKNKSYLELGQKVNKVVLNLKYEDIVLDPLKIVEKVVGILNEDFEANKFTNVEKSTKHDQKLYEEYKTFYLNEEWRKELASEDIELINERLDLELMEQFGYQKLINTA